MPASSVAGQPSRETQSLSSAFASFRNVEPWIPMLVLGVAALGDGADRAAVERLDLGAAHEVARHARRGARAPGSRRPSFEAAAHRPVGAAARVGARRRADGDRLVEARHPPAGVSAGRSLAGAGRSDPGARARTHSQARLPGEPSAGAARNPSITLLSGGYRVAFAPSARTAATTWRSASVGIRSPTRARSRTSRSCAVPRASW